MASNQLHSMCFWSCVFFCCWKKRVKKSLRKNSIWFWFEVRRDFEHHTKINHSPIYQGKIRRLHQSKSSRPPRAFFWLRYSFYPPLSSAPTSWYEWHHNANSALEIKHNSNGKYRTLRDTNPMWAWQTYSASADLTTLQIISFVFRVIVDLHQHGFGERAS